jgi:hypothetical protein
MSPDIRKLVLTSHIIISVGWLGAVAGFLALSIAGLTGDDPQTVRGAYVAMELSGWFVIVPLSFGALLTGLIQSLGTPWGLFKHYWILVKFILTIGATVLLLLHMQPVSLLAGIASETELLNTEQRGLRIQLIADAGAALLVLIVNTVLSVYKPWGRTPYGIRKQQEQNKEVTNLQPPAKRYWGRYAMIAFIVFVLVFIILHLI